MSEEEYARLRKELGETPGFGWMRLGRHGKDHYFDENGVSLCGSFSYEPHLPLGKPSGEQCPVCSRVLQSRIGHAKMLLSRRSSLDPPSRQEE
jgi:hypothetical protein